MTSAILPGIRFPLRHRRSWRRSRGRDRRRSESRREPVICFVRQ